MTQSEIFTEAHQYTREKKEKAIKRAERKNCKVDFCYKDVFTGKLLKIYASLRKNAKRTVKTIERETDKAVLAYITINRTGTAKYDIWIPKSQINENGVVSDWFWSEKIKWKWGGQYHDFLRFV